MSEHTTGSSFPTSGRRLACIPARAVFDSRLRPALLRTLLALGLHTNKEGRCRVRVGVLAAIIDTHPKNVQRYLRELESLGYLHRVAQHCSNGRQRENAYELVLGGEYAATPPGGVRSYSPHKERVLERGTTAGRAGGKEETNMWGSEPDACTDGLAREIDVRDRSTRPKVPKKQPAKLNAHTVAVHAVNVARSLQFGCANPATHEMMRGCFRRLHDQGVDYRTIYVAIELFKDAWTDDIEAPFGRLFIKQAYQWVEEAKKVIYHEDLPAKQAANVAMWDAIYADLAVWEAGHPDATERDRSRYKAERFQHYRHAHA